MECIYEKRHKDGKNTVDGLAKWLKDNELVESEESAKNLFKNVRDKEKVEYSEFEQALTKIADTSGKDLSEIVKSLTDGHKITGALKAALNTFVNALKK